MKRSVSIVDSMPMAPAPYGKKGRRFSCPPACTTDNAILIKRPPYTQIAFDEVHFKSETSGRTLCEKIRGKLYCSKKRLWKTACTYIPIIKVLRYYNLKTNLLIDILAGLTVGILHIPQALAFGQLTSVKIENGLFTSLWPVLLYVFFGTSAHVSMGTSAVICILTASVVDRQGADYVANNPHLLNYTINGTHVPLDDVPEYLDFKEGIAMTVTLTTGLMMVLMGILKLGFITAYLSESFFAAFTSGAAIHIATSQVPAMLGISVQRHSGVFKIVKNYMEIFGVISEVNVAAIVCALITCIVIFLVKECINERFKHKLFVPLPIELFVVIAGTVIAYFADLGGNFGISVVGEIPNTIPPPTIPPLNTVPSLIVDSFIIAILIFANTIAMAKICAKKHNYEVDDSQEFIAYGMCNFVSSFFRCFPSSVAPPRSMVSSAMNTKSTLNGIFTTMLMLLLIMVISVLFTQLPKSILAAIIFISLKGLFIQIGDGKKFWHINKFDFVIWLFTILSVVFLDIDFGLGIGVCVSLITVVFQTQFARGYRIGRTMKDSALVEHKRYQDSVEISGIKIFRFQSSLYFANAEIFRNRLYRSTVNPRKLLKLLKKNEVRLARLAKQKEKLGDNRESYTKTNGVENDGLKLSESENNLVRMNSNDSAASLSTPRGSISSIECPAFSLSDTKTTDGYTLKQNAFGSSNQSIVSRHMSIDSSTTLRSDDEEDPEDGEEIVTDEKLKKLRRTHHVIIDCSVINYLDASGANVLSHIFTEYGHVNIKVFLAGCSYDMRRAMKHAGCFDKIPQDNIFLDVYDALSVAKIQHILPLLPDLDDFSDEEAAEDSYVTKM
ncbi:sulfate transporter-like [Gigantopelta aegis]|uniref:sulfate transporter-like n=1 Tax=Gigantopelta aegis TaxID=1735272 RepID=UPI001B88D403|nr:sulfate transporter-like [Gigantopelta aegis]